MKKKKTSTKTWVITWDVPPHVTAKYLNDLKRQIFFLPPRISNDNVQKFMKFIYFNSPIFRGDEKLFPIRDRYKTSPYISNGGCILILLGECGCDLIASYTSVNAKTSEDYSYSKYTWIQQPAFRFKNGELTRMGHPTEKTFEVLH